MTEMASSISPTQIKKQRNSPNFRYRTIYMRKEWTPAARPNLGRFWELLFAIHEYQLRAHVQSQNSGPLSTWSSWKMKNLTGFLLKIHRPEYRNTLNLDTNRALMVHEYGGCAFGVILFVFLSWFQNLRVIWSDMMVLLWPEVSYYATTKGTRNAICPSPRVMPAIGTVNNISTAASN